MFTKFVESQVQLARSARALVQAVGACSALLWSQLLLTACDEDGIDAGTGEDFDLGIEAKGSWGTALVLGELTPLPMQHTGIVKAEPQEQFFMFAVEPNSDVEISVRTGDASATARLYPRPEGLFDDDDFAYSWNIGPRATQSLKAPLPAGIYLLRLSTTGSITADEFELQLLARPAERPEPYPGPGGEHTTALDLGSIDAVGQQFGGYVGRLDPIDYYEFAVPTAGTLYVGASATHADLAIRLFVKTEPFSILNHVGALVTTVNLPNAGTIELPAGSYYLMAHPDIDDGVNSTHYNVDLSLKP